MRVSEAPPGSVVRHLRYGWIGVVWNDTPERNLTLRYNNSYGMWLRGTPSNTAIGDTSVLGWSMAANSEVEVIATQLNFEGLI